MSDSKTDQPGTDKHSGNSNSVTTGRRAYTPPRVLGAEALEAAAATCDPPAGGFGKSVPIPCINALGS